MPNIVFGLVLFVYVDLPHFQFESMQDLPLEAEFGWLS